MSGDTDVTVVAAGFQRFYQWWQDNWGPLQTIAGAIGGRGPRSTDLGGARLRGWCQHGAAAPTQPARAADPPGATCSAFARSSVTHGDRPAADGVVA